MYTYINKFNVFFNQEMKLTVHFFSPESFCRYSMCTTQKSGKKKKIFPSKVGHPDCTAWEAKPRAKKNAMLLLLVKHAALSTRQ